MKQTVNLEQFRQAFKDMNRDHYTYEGYRAIFEDIEAFEDSFGEETELDVIAICGEYTEYSEKELMNEYGWDVTFDNLTSELRDSHVETLNNTIVFRSY